MSDKWGDDKHTIQIEIGEGVREPNTNPTPAEMREAADTLEHINRLYGFRPDYAGWSPKGLRAEADHLDKVNYEGNEL